MNTTKRITAFILAFVTAFTLIPAVSLSDNKTSVQAYADEYDEDDYKFSDVHKRYSAIAVSDSTDHTFKAVDGLKYGKTNIYPIHVKKSGKYEIGFKGDSSYGSGTIGVGKDDDPVEKNFSLDFNTKKWTFSLYKGNNYIKVLSTESINLDYHLYIRAKSFKKTVSTKVESCYYKKLKSGHGKGRWSTSNRHIVALPGKTSNVSNCKIWGKKPGKATVTYKNSNGAVIKYKVRVYKTKSYPIAGAGCMMNTVGGLEPYIYIANNSGRKIKYVHARIYFYNAVGDRAYNSIGSYPYADLTMVGPIAPWKNGYYDWENDPVFYNGVATKMKIGTVTIEYFGGKKVTRKINRKYTITE